MKDTRIVMGMPITVDVVDPMATAAHIDQVFAFFESVDERFSPFKETSELTRLNHGLITADGISQDMREILQLAEETRRQTDGYFDVRLPNGTIDTCGIVKGWAIQRAVSMLETYGYQNFFVDAGGDIQVKGVNHEGRAWSVGIQNPFTPLQTVKRVHLAHNEGIATSGTYVRGQHIYDPYRPSRGITEIVSLTVIGPSVFDADRFATAAFAMGKKGIAFIERLKGFEAYLIDAQGIATMTSAFEMYIPAYAERF